jgi:hypothetical protein
MDPTQRECAKCSLFAQKSEPIPEGGELAWSLYFDLNSEIVRRFNLTDHIWECYDLDLTIMEFIELVTLLESIDFGISEWHKENQKKEN